MAKFSHEARRFAAAAKALGLLQPEPPPLAKAVEVELPTHIPLGRKRDVELHSMANEEVLAALDQCRARVGRTKDSDPNLPRYLLMLQAAEAESNRRNGARELPEEPDDELEAAEEDEEDHVHELVLADRTVAPGGFENEEPPAPRFGSHPSDTPDSDSLDPNW